MCWGKESFVHLHHVTFPKKACFCCKIIWAKMCETWHQICLTMGQTKLNDWKSKKVKEVFFPYTEVWNKVFLFYNNDCFLLFPFLSQQRCIFIPQEYMLFWGDLVNKNICRSVFLLLSIFIPCLNLILPWNNETYTGSYFNYPTGKLILSHVYNVYNIKLYCKYRLNKITQLVSAGYKMIRTLDVYLLAYFSGSYICSFKKYTVCSNIILLTIKAVIYT